MQYFSVFPFFIFFKVIVFEVSFSQASRKVEFFSLKEVEFFLPFGFCPPKVGPVVCLSFVQGEICVEFLLVCLSSDGQA